MVFILQLDVWKYPADKYDFALLMVQSQDKEEIKKKFEKFGITGAAADQFDDEVKR